MFNLIRTGVLIAALTALFMVVGYFIGGQTGIFIAFLVAAGTNLFAYWNADKVVLSMQGALEVDPRRAPDLFRMVETLARPRRHSDAEALCDRDSAAQCLRHRPQPRRMRRSRCRRACSTRSSRMKWPASSRMSWRISKTATTLTMTITATLAGAISMLAQFGLFFGGGNRNNPLAASARC